jgi:hypothetical protein
MVKNYQGNLHRWLDSYRRRGLNRSDHLKKTLHVLCFQVVPAEVVVHLTENPPVPETYIVGIPNELHEESSPLPSSLKTAAPTSEYTDEAKLVNYYQSKVFRRVARENAKKLFTEGAEQANNVDPVSIT